MNLTCNGKGGHLRGKNRGEGTVKDKKDGDRDRWNCDALHSIMLMRRIIISSPQAVEADRGCECFTFDAVVCVCVCVSVVKAGK